MCGNYLTSDRVKQPYLSFPILEEIIHAFVLQEEEGKFWMNMYLQYVEISRRQQTFQKLVCRVKTTKFLYRVPQRRSQKEPDNKGK